MALDHGSRLGFKLGNNFKVFSPEKLRVLIQGFRVEGLGLRLHGLGLRVSGLGVVVQVIVFRALCSKTWAYIPPTLRLRYSKTFTQQKLVVSPNKETPVQIPKNSEIV